MPIIVCVNFGKVIFSFSTFSSFFSLLSNNDILLSLLKMLFPSSFFVSPSGVGVVSNNPKLLGFIVSFFSLFSSFFGVDIFSLLKRFVSPNKVLSLFSILFSLSIFPKRFVLFFLLFYYY